MEDFELEKLNQKKEKKTFSILTDDDISDESEGWLVSYADLMTLIACFFILLTAFANYDDIKFKNFAQELGKHFKASDVKPDDDAINNIKAFINSDVLMKDIMELKSNPVGLDITFMSAHLFETGSADVKENIRILLERLVEFIKLKNKEYIVKVEGHTDNMPIGSITKKKYPTNWELSSARASSIVRIFEEKEFNRKNLEAIGYSDTRPRYPNQNKNGENIYQNMAKNRRVIIKIINKEQKKTFKMGLGNMIESNEKHEKKESKNE